MGRLLTLATFSVVFSLALAANAQDGPAAKAEATKKEKQTTTLSTAPTGLNLLGRWMEILMCVWIIL